MTRRGSDEPSSEGFTQTEVTALPPITTPDDLAQAVKLLRETKAQDLAAKRAKKWDERPALGKRIYDLARAVAAAKEAHVG